MLPLIAILLFAIFIYIGLTNMPWPAIVAVCTLAGWRVGGLFHQLAPEAE